MLDVTSPGEEAGFKAFMIHCEVDVGSREVDDGVSFSGEGVGTVGLRVSVIGEDVVGTEAFGDVVGLLVVCKEMRSI